MLLGAAALDILRREERAGDGRPANPWLHGGAWRAGGGGAELRLRHGADDYRLATSRLPDGSWEIALGGEVARVTVEPFGHGALVREGSRSIPVRGVATADGYLLAWEGGSYTFTRPAPPSVEAAVHAAGAGSGGGHDSLTAPMPGTIITVNVAEGDRVAANQPLLVLEAMKMEHTIAAPHAGTVARLRHRAGEIVPAGATLVEIDEA